MRWEGYFYFVCGIIYCIKGVRFLFSKKMPKGLEKRLPVENLQKYNRLNGITDIVFSFFWGILGYNVLMDDPAKNLPLIIPLVLIGIILLCRAVFNMKYTEIHEMKDLFF